MIRNYFLASLFAILTTACVPRDAAVQSSSGPGYMQESVRRPPQQTDFFGNSLRRQSP